MLSFRQGPLKCFIYRILEGIFAKIRGGHIA